MARRKVATPPEPPTTVGSVQRLLESLRREGAMDAHDEALGLVALRLARALDSEATSAPVVASLSRELRSTMAELTKGRAGDDVDGDGFASSLPPAVWDAPES